MNTKGLKVDTSSAEIHVFLFNVDDECIYNDFYFELLLRLLPLRQQNKILSLRATRQAQTAKIVNAVALKYVLFSLSYLDTLEAEIKRGPFGKPYINDPVEFNISDEGSWVALAISWHGPMGIDLADTQTVRDFNLSPKEFVKDFRDIFTKSEVSHVMRTLPPGREYTFLSQYWAFKESASKLTGFGLYKPLSSYESHLPDLEQYKASFRNHLDGGIGFINQFVVAGSILCSVASSNDMDVVVHRISLKSVIDFAKESDQVIL